MTKKRNRSPKSPHSRHQFDVFAFNEEDEKIQTQSAKILSKFRKPNNKINKSSRFSPLTKYAFLQCFAQGAMTSENKSACVPIDVDANATERKDCCSGPFYVDIDLSGSPSICSEAYSSSVRRASNPGLTSASSRQLMSSISPLMFNTEPTALLPENDSIGVSSQSTSASGSTENGVALGKSALKCVFGVCKIVTDNNTVSLSPDFIVYRDMRCAKSLLTFSSRCIRLEGLIVNGEKKSFAFEWSINDIIKIESKWCRRDETAMVNLHLRSEDTEVSGNVNGASGAGVLKFAVYDPCWSETQEAIKSLDFKYKAVWNVVFDIESVRDNDIFLGQTDMFLSEDCYSGFEEPSEVLIYPKGDLDAITISQKDIELLQPQKFINDTIIDFYIKYLKTKIQPEEKNRFHFFNSFFFRKLADFDKDHSKSACYGRAAFQRVCKWTRKVNLFEKDYIVMPVNFSLHWSLIIICHPGEVANFKDDGIDKLPKIPCILHMDSIRGCHRGLNNLIRSYLWEEWKERQGDSAKDVSSRFLDLHFLSLELPQQENSFDCGLFVLHYVELFLKQAPSNFNPFEMQMHSNFLNRDWFHPAEASSKRASIKKLIHEILALDVSQNDYQEFCNCQKPAAHLTDTNETEIAFEIEDGHTSTKLEIEKSHSSTKLDIEECHSPTKLEIEESHSSEFSHGNSSSLNADQITEVPQVSPSPSSIHIECSRKTESLGRELFLPGATTGLLDECCQKVLLSHKEEVEIEDQTPRSPVNAAECQEVDEISIKPSLLDRDFVLSKTSWNPGISMFEKPKDGESSSPHFIRSSENSLEVEMFNEWPRKLIIDSDREIDISEVPSTSSEDLENCVVEDSQEPNGEHDNNESVESILSIRGKVLAPPFKECIDLEEEIKPLRIDDPLPESSNEQQAAKRRRFVTPRESKKRLITSLTEGLDF